MEDKKQTAQVELDISGMTCAACASRIERALGALEGVHAVVNPAIDRASVQLDREIPLRTLLDAVAAAGYGASVRAPPRSGLAEGMPAHDAAGRYAGWAAAFAVIFAAQMVAMLVWGHAAMLPAPIQLALAVPAQTLLAWPFHRAAVRALRHGSANMDVLVSLGTSIAFFASIAAWLSDRPHEIAFEAGVMIIALVWFGRWLEGRAKRGNRDALDALLRSLPARARRIREDAVEDVDIHRLEVGDLVRVLAGERIPVDGRVAEGSVHVDTATLTGESAPRVVDIDVPVLAAMVVLDGVLDVRVERVGEQTEIARIAHAVEHAQSTKPQVQALADAIAAWFVPGVVVLAAIVLGVTGLATGSWNDAIWRAVAVLVVACPCALGLATPMAVTVGMTRAAREGVLFRDARALERTGALERIAFDKTGTLTLGRMSVVKVITAPGVDKQQAMAIAHSLELGVTSPLAAAILSYDVAEMPAARATDAPVDSVLDTPKGESPRAPHRPGADLPLADYTVVPGRGVRAKLGHDIVWAGSARMARELQAALDDDGGWDWQDAITTHAQGDETIVVVGSNTPVAVLLLRDGLRPEAVDVIAALIKAGIRPLLLSGDRRDAVALVARAVGIAEFEGELLPADKVAQIAALSRQGQRVGMVGDGINDGPALAAANVGFAVASGSDLAKSAADVTLTREDLWPVVAAIDVARATLAKIRGNLAVSFAFNSVGMALAALGWLSPVASAAIMSTSSLTVVFNALLLHRHAVPTRSAHGRRPGS